MMKVERGPKTSPVFSTLIFLFQNFLKLKLPHPLYFPSIFGFSMVNYTVGPSGPWPLGPRPRVDLQNFPKELVIGQTLFWHCFDSFTVL